MFMHKGGKSEGSWLWKNIRPLYDVWKSQMDVGVFLFNRLLLSIDRRRSIEDAKETVKLAETYMKTPAGDHKAKVVGIDLSGDPSVSG